MGSPIVLPYRQSELGAGIAAGAQGFAGPYQRRQEALLNQQMQREQLGEARQMQAASQREFGTLLEQQLAQQEQGIQQQYRDQLQRAEQLSTEPGVLGTSPQQRAIQEANTLLEQQLSQLAPARQVQGVFSGVEDTPIDQDVANLFAGAGFTAQKAPRKQGLGAQPATSGAIFSDKLPKATENYVERTIENAESAQQSLQNYQAMRSLIDQGVGTLESRYNNALSSIPGLRWLRDPNTEEFEARAAEMIERVGKMIKGKVTDADLRYFSGKLPDISKNPAANRQILAIAEEAAALELQRNKLMNEIVKETGGQIPANLPFIIDQLMNPAQEQLAEKVRNLRREDQGQGQAGQPKQRMSDEQIKESGRTRIQIKEGRTFREATVPQDQLEMLQERLGQDNVRILQ